MSEYRLWVNADRTLLVREWDTGDVEICERDHPAGIWGPPKIQNCLPGWVGDLTEEVVA